VTYVRGFHCRNVHISAAVSWIKQSWEELARLGPPCAGCNIMNRALRFRTTYPSCPNPRPATAEIKADGLADFHLPLTGGYGRRFVTNRLGLVDHKPFSPGIGRVAM